MSHYEKANAATTTSQRSTILTFRLDGHVYGLPASQVVQIIEMLAITPLPHLPKSMQGIFNFHGRVVPVMDLRRQFNLAVRPYGLHTPIILAEWQGQILGLVVDEVEAILEDVELDAWSGPSRLIPRLLEPDRQKPPRSMFSHLAKAGDQFIPLLQLDALLNHEEQIQLDQALSQQTLSGPLV